MALAPVAVLACGRPVSGSATGSTVAEIRGKNQDAAASLRPTTPSTMAVTLASFKRGSNH